MQVLGAHMLRYVIHCQDITAGHPLDIGGKADPPRLVFDVASGPAICVAIMDLGNRFRLVLNEVDVVEPEQPLPKLPVARALWEPRPNLPVAATSWILAGGSHHSGFSQAVTTEHIKDFAEIAGLELLIIDGNTNVWDFKQQLKLNEVYYQMPGFLGNLTLGGESRDATPTGPRVARFEKLAYGMFIHWDCTPAGSRGVDYEQSRFPKEEYAPLAKTFTEEEFDARHCSHRPSGRDEVYYHYR